ncbi:MAG: EAL domain-containing protein [Lachnospiraceae bacterium]|nr:EAL domain-containing protein [Lachnospiraceae bacterium]
MSDPLSLALSRIGNQYHKILLLNLTRETYTSVFIGKDGEEWESAHAQEAKLEELWQQEFSRELIYPDDRRNVDKLINSEYLKQFFQTYHGEEYYWVRYRKLTGGEYRPYRLEAFPAENYSDDNQVIYLYFMDLSGRLYQESNYLGELLQSLSENYESIYYVDFDKDISIPYRMSKLIEDNFGAFFRTNPSYETAMTAYVKKAVSKKDLQEMLELSRTDFIKERLHDRRSYSHDYMVIREGRELTYRFKISKVNDGSELHRAVVGFAEITGENPGSVNLYRSFKRLLLVSSNAQTQYELHKILNEVYSLDSACTVGDAMHFLEDVYKEVSIVITDLVESESDGYELIHQMKANANLRDIPIIVVSERGKESATEIQAEIKCLELGAADFILKPFVPDIVLNRVKSLIRLRESTAMLSILERDPLTGLYAKEFFFKKVEDYLAEHPTHKYMLWVSDIQGLKVINEKYGYEKGDALLRTMADYGVRHTPGFIFGGRIEGDKLAALVIARDKEEMNQVAMENDNNTPFPVPNVVIKHGIYRIDPRLNVTPQGMYDRAMLALQKIKSRYGVYLAEYNDELRQDLLLRQMILGSADDALKEHQFKVYYQPKHDFHTDRTCGAEGLVRWQHPDIGFMNPILFLSLFEQNGFITKMDFYVWEEICKTIKKWERDGIPVVPVSINVSRRDFEVPDLAGRITALVDGYDIPHDMVHVEVTESAYSDDPQRITETVKKLHDLGFVIEMDDFGTGYSSLIALSSMDLDVLKLDRSIIENDKPGSEKNILEFSMQLAKMLHLKTVAEGVETKEQMERISELGGDYIQGYYYSKPLPADEFAEYLVKKNQAAETEKKDSSPADDTCTNNMCADNANTENDSL